MGKFTDKQFPAENKSIGVPLVGKLGGTDNLLWSRASEMKDPDGKSYSLFTDGVDVNDVRQGMLGDCYFLSALAVLSNDDVRDKFIFEIDDEWETCGAFCIKFYDDGKEDIIIVDDQIVQTKGSDELAFC